MTQAIFHDHAEDIEKNSEMAIFVRGIDFEPLFAKIRNLANVECEFEELEAIADDVGGRIKFKSTDLTSQAGVFAAAFCKVYIHASNAWIIKAKDTGEWIMKSTIDLRYIHHGRGSNGAQIAWATYTEKDGWNVISEKQNNMYTK